MPDDIEHPPAPARAGRLLVVAAAVAAVEALVFVVLGVLDLTSVVSSRWGSGVVAGVLLLGYGFGILLAAAQLLRLRIGARGPLVVAQLIQLGLAWNIRDIDAVWLPVSLAAAAIVVLAGLLARSTTQALLDAEDV